MWPLHMRSYVILTHAHAVHLFWSRKPLPHDKFSTAMMQHAAEGLKINLPPLHHSLASRCHCVACEGGREGEEILLAADYEMHVALRGGAMVEGMKFLFLHIHPSPPSFITSLKGRKGLHKTTCIT